MDPTLLVALVALVAALPYAIKKIADARLVLAQSAQTRADTARDKVAIEKADSDVTGRIVIGREADAETIRAAFRTLQARLDRCEARHEEAEQRHERERETWRAAMAAKDSQIDALWAECRALRQAIEGAKR